ncbi:GNAT family N-acetyltransferase [Kordiimonas lipolytica]|uniref:GNAT family N-acetyltransferase n=1 Tax=Kordiimonas lipolytica TaxID=1662421 RepID=A0ABV8UC01_9PROT|nr:bifunctional helix-turn-helix transcriptional regulator/GNAT family N-acetyltransferase [Kordiimonas lipolytica]
MSIPNEIFFELGVGTRMRRLQEQLTADADRIYEEAGLKFRVSYFYAMYALSEYGSMPIGEIARLAGFSHSAVSQTVKRMAGEGLVETTAMDDGRQKCVQLTAAGQAMVDEARPIWQDLEAVNTEAGASKLLAGIDAMEATYADKSLYERVKERQAARQKTVPEFELVPYDIRFKQAFYDLNAWWVEKYFKMEPIDETVLSDPETHILAKGGEIYFTLIGGKPVGAVAMKLQSPGVYELTKLGVDPNVQQGGMGRALCEKVIERFQARGGKTLYLETNTKLEPAIRLYEKLGFVELTPSEPSPYERANHYMEWKGRPNDRIAAE